MEDSDPSEVGVQMALDRICALEAKIRQAIQNTHPLSSSFDRDAQAADREREALLAVRETLELLEDKLREFRDSKSDEDRQTMALSQLDSLRRELIVAARDSLALVIFAKDVVREVLAFAEMAAGEPAPTGRDMPLSPIQQVNNNGLYSPHSRSPSFTKPSPKPRKDLFLRTSVGENMLGPAPLPAPSMSPKQTQTRRGLWQPGSPNAHDSPGRPRHVRGTVEEADRIIYAASRNPDAGSRRQSPSHQLHPARVRVDEQELYSTTNGSSRYHYDPEYGGKVNLTNFRHKQEGAAEQPEPDVRIPALEHGARVLDVFSDDRSTRSARTAYDPRLDDDVSSVSTRAYSHHHRQYHSPAPSGTRRLGMDGLPRGGRLPAPEPVTVPLPKRSGRGFWGTVGVCVQILVAGAIMAAAASGVALAAEWYQSEEQQAKRAVWRAQRAERLRIRQQAQAADRQRRAVQQQARAEEQQRRAAALQAEAAQKQQAAATAAAQAAQARAAQKALQEVQQAAKVTKVRAQQVPDSPSRGLPSLEVQELPHVGMQLKAPPAGVLFPALPPPDVFQGRG